MLLGGSAQQIAAIETAKRLGYYTVLCDFLTDNPGQYHADKFYLVSTTDREAVLEVAKQEKIDGILAYASDPAVPTAAYVAQELGLPGNPYESVEILCNKDRFRAFLEQHDFCTPKARGYCSTEEAASALRAGVFQFPVIVKPVDSSGSKGVGRIDCAEDAEKRLEYAMRFSRCKKIIVEEYVEKYGYQVAGDGLSIDGKLVFRCFGNDHFDPEGINPYVPIAASFPLAFPDWVHEKIHNEIQRLLTLLNMGNCTYNFDIRVDKDMNVYLMEVAPRDGGNYIPQIIKHITGGTDLVEYSVRMAMGESVSSPQKTEPLGFASYFAIHSDADGYLDHIEIDDVFREKHIVEEFYVRPPGGRVLPFRGANTSLGCYLMRFDSMDQMTKLMDHPNSWIKVVVREA